MKAAIILLAAAAVLLASAPTPHATPVAMLDDLKFRATRAVKDMKERINGEKTWITGSLKKQKGVPDLPPIEAFTGGQGTSSLAFAPCPGVDEANADLTVESVKFEKGKFIIQAKSKGGALQGSSLLAEFSIYKTPKKGLGTPAEPIAVGSTENMRTKVYQVVGAQDVPFDYANVFGQDQKPKELRFSQPSIYVDSKKSYRVRIHATP